VIYLNRQMPLEGGLYQWAKLGISDLLGFMVAWNLWLFAILNTSEIGLQLTQYIIYIAGAVFFAVQPAFQTGSWTTASVYGAAFGFCAYATYDLTNQATLKNWPVAITVADICWGTVLTAIAATAGFLVSSALTRTA